MKCELCEKEAVSEISFPFNFTFAGYKYHWVSFRFTCEECERAYDCNEQIRKRFKIKLNP